MKIYEIVPGKLYQRGEFMDFPREIKLSELRRRGIDIVINVWSKSDKEISEEMFRYIHWPLPDGELRACDKQFLSGVAMWVVGDISDGHRVLVHCHAGRNRSALVSALLVRQLFGMSGAQAIEYVRERRPNALANEHFCNYLRGLL